jgi:carbon storage regulator CsrA
VSEGDWLEAADPVRGQPRHGESDAGTAAATAHHWPFTDVARGADFFNPKGVARMLVFNRRVDQEIIIADVIRVMIVQIVNDPRGRRVKLGIEAPREIPIRRSELPASDFLRPESPR